MTLYIGFLKKWYFSWKFQSGRKMNKNGPNFTLYLNNMTQKGQQKILIFFSCDMTWNHPNVPNFFF